jgi:hypothetical protein
MKTHSTFKLLALVAASSALFGPRVANALTIGLDDSATGVGYDVIVTDAGIGDSNPLAGAVTYIGSTPNWTLNVTTGLTSLPPYLDLNSVNAFNATAGQLKISVWDTYNAPTPSWLSNFVASIGGTTQGTVDVTYTQYNANTGPGGTVLSTVSDGTFGPRSFAGTVGLPASVADIGGAFNLQIDVIIGHTSANQVTSFDAEISPVPVPAAAWLFGSAVVGLVGVGRRKSTRTEA